MSPAIVTLTAMQAMAVEIIIKQALDGLARFEMIKNYSDEQCQILIDHAVETKDSLDARMARH